MDQEPQFIGGIVSSKEIGQLAAALAKAQSTMRPATKDKANPFFGSQYADLAGVIDVSRAALTDNGIAVIQSASLLDANHVGVTTMLAHESGEWVRSTLSCEVAFSKRERDAPLEQLASAQAVGACVTYLRRYGYSAMAGVATDDDDDGNAASNRDGGGKASSSAASRRASVGKAAASRSKRGATTRPQAAQDDPPHPAGGDDGGGPEPGPDAPDRDTSVRAWYADRKVQQFKDRDGTMRPVHSFSDDELNSKREFFAGKGYDAWCESIDDEMMRRSLGGDD